MAEFTSDIRHIKGADNVAADTLSRIFSLDSSPPVDFAVLASEQKLCPEVLSLQDNKMASGLNLRLVPHEGHNILCDLSLARPQPLVPVSLQSSVFSTIHGLAHQGPIPTIKAISQRFVW